MKKEAKENAKPKILKQTFTNNNVKNETIEERLLGFQKRYDGKKL